MVNCDVIVPCYNYGRFLTSCVESVLEESSCQIRILILDDASTDNSFAIAREIAARDGRVHVVRHEANKRHIATYNEGINWVDADYMLLLSADDLVAPGALGRAIALMEAHKDVHFVYGKAIKFADESELPADPPAGRQVSTTIRAGRDFIKDLCVTPLNPIQTATAVVRAPVQKRVGGYDPRLPHAGDLEMWLRFAAVGAVGIVDAVQAFTRIHGANMRFTYATDAGIRDFLQRRDAYQIFFASPLAAGPEIGQLSAAASRSLAEEALWNAARAAEEGAREAAARWSALAKETHPAIVATPLWWKFQLRKQMGPRLSRSVSRLLEGAKRRLAGVSGSEKLNGKQI